MVWRSLVLFYSLVLTWSTTWADSTAKCEADDSWSIRLGNANITINNDFVANIAGSAPDKSYAINITRSKGTLTQGTRITPVVVNLRIPRTADYTVYNFIGADSLGLISGRAYCDNASGYLSAVWIEDSSSSTGLNKTAIVGRCDIDLYPTAQQQDTYTVPDRCLAIKPAAAASSYPTISGSQISLSPNGAGNITLNQTVYNLLPYSVLNCKNCGSTPQAGWIEIHSIMQSKDKATASDICMGILYVYLQKAPIFLSWLNCFLPQQANATFDADYKIQDFNANNTSPITLDTMDDKNDNSSGYSSSSSSSSTTTKSGGRYPLDSDGNLTTRAKIGIGFAVGITVLALVMLGWVCRKMRKKDKVRREKEARWNRGTGVVEAPDNTGRNGARAELNNEDRHDRAGTAELDEGPSYRLKDLNEETGQNGR